MAKKKARATKKAPTPAKVKAPKTLGIFPFSTLKPEAIARLKTLEVMLGVPVVCLVQDGRGKLDSVDHIAKQLLFDLRYAESPFKLERGQPVALLIDSNGGQANSAFEIATLLQNHCGGFKAVVPRHAKSAATLICLGADEIILGEFGELGPLDAQVFNEDREERVSALDEVQALERLHAFSMTAIDQTMWLLASRSSLKLSSLLPIATEIVTGMVQPMFSGVDVIRYTKLSRVLRVGEEYARRLLMRRFPKEKATDIARNLVELYPEHGFIIDTKEAETLKLAPAKPDDDLRDLLNSISKDLQGKTAIGRIGEIDE